MHRRGNCDDYVVAERFFQLLKRERIGRQTYQTHDAARQDAFDYMEMFYNPTRKHTNTGMLSPVGYETEQQKMNEAGGQQTRELHIDLFLGWYSEDMAEKEVFFPAKGYKWNDLKGYNTDLRMQRANLDWNAARDLLNVHHSALVHFLTENPDADLYSGPMQGSSNTWTSGRWAEAAGPSHCRSAAKFVRSVLRTAN